MKLFHILALLITIAAAFSYLNYRFLRLPNTIGRLVRSSAQPEAEPSW